MVYKAVYELCGTKYSCVSMVLDKTALGIQTDLQQLATSKGLE